VSRYHEVRNPLNGTVGWLRELQNAVNLPAAEQRMMAGAALGTSPGLARKFSPHVHPACPALLWPAILNPLWTCRVHRHRAQLPELAVDDFEAGGQRAHANASPYPA
jgi:hypothetical protein